MMLRATAAATLGFFYVDTPAQPFPVIWVNVSYQKEKNEN